MTTRLTLAIQEHLEALAPSERKLAALLLERTDDLLTYSASELARMAGVSKATAARLFRSLGYADFNEVRLQARQERNLAPPFAAAARAPREAAPAKGGAPSIAAHLAIETDSLARTFETLRGDVLRDAASRLARAPRVWLLGIGLDDGLARFAWPQLARVRPDVFCLGTAGRSWAEELASVTPRDGLLFVLTQPRGHVVEQVLAHAKAARVQTVAVVDVRNAGWARRVADVVLPCWCASAEHAFSPMAAASLLHLLTQHVALKLGPRAAQRQGLIADLRRELEDE